MYKINLLDILFIQIINLNLLSFKMNLLCLTLSLKNLIIYIKKYFYFTWFIRQDCVIEEQRPNPYRSKTHTLGGGDGRVIGGFLGGGAGVGPRRRCATFPRTRSTARRRELARLFPVPLPRRGLLRSRSVAIPPPPRLRQELQSHSPHRRQVLSRYSFHSFLYSTNTRNFMCSRFCFSYTLLDALQSSFRNFAAKTSGFNTSIMLNHLCIICYAITLSFHLLLVSSLPGEKTKQNSSQVTKKKKSE